jgi:anti-sigma regulatory factor (Ser/Thr protein kinase)
MEIDLAPSPTAPALGRRAIGRFAVSPDARERAELIVSELLTNAFTHAGLRPDQRVALALELHGSELHIEVRDPGRGFDPAAPRSPHRVGGFGLVLVDELATRWDVTVDADGTSVSCVVDGSAPRRRLLT